MFCHVKISIEIRNQKDLWRDAKRVHFYSGQLI